MRVRLAGMIVVALLLLTGCTFATDGAEPPDPAVAAPAPDFMIAVVDRLGPVPPRPEYTPLEEEQARIQHVEAEWAQLLVQYPAAERTAVELERYVDSVDELSTAQMACLAELGFETVPGHTTDGKIAGFEFVIDPGQEQATAVASWQCSTRFAFRPSPPLTEQELGYLYDYFVEFQVPCLEAEGQHQVPAPTREFFIEEWPRQEWWPRPSVGAIDTEEWDRLEGACPSVPRGFR